jgi:hypothetical protein
MKEHQNPYPEMITDESSGINVANTAHRIWLEGYRAGREDAAADEKVPPGNR